MSPRPIRVFIVDDHPLVREWLAKLLEEQADLKVCGQAEDVREALAGMTAQPPDVAVVDLSLKGGSGIDLIKAMRDRFASTRVVVLSMHEEVGYAERAIRAGALAYVTKRESTRHIVEAIRSVMLGKVFANRDLLARLAERMVGRPAGKPVEIADLLSDRELEVFNRLGRGQGTREIADSLGVSAKTVQAYCARIKEKLGLEGINELIREAVKWVERG